MHSYRTSMPAMQSFIFVVSHVLILFSLHFDTFFVRIEKKKYEIDTNDIKIALTFYRKTGDLARVHEISFKLQDQIDLFFFR